MFVKSNVIPIVEFFTSNINQSFQVKPYSTFTKEKQQHLIESYGNPIIRKVLIAQVSFNYIILFNSFEIDYLMEKAEFCGDDEAAEIYELINIYKCLMY